MLLNLDNQKRVTDHQFVGEIDLDVVNAELIELNTGEEVDVCSVCFDFTEFEVNSCFRDDCLVVWSENARALLKLTNTVGPAGPNTELEQTHGDVGGWHSAEDADEGVHAIDFLPHVFADDGSLKGRNDVVWNHSGAKMNESLRTASRKTVQICVTFKRGRGRGAPYETLLVERIERALYLVLRQTRRSWPLGSYCSALPMP